MPSRLSAPTAACPDDLRPVTLTLGVQKWAEGSCLIRVGDTEVLCAATIEDKIAAPSPRQGHGLGHGRVQHAAPRHERTELRESAKGRLGGRTHEIQRLVGRSLRGVVDLAKLGERTITIDCDVLQADGGTRTASITGGYVALAAALIGPTAWSAACSGKVAAVSVGHRRRRHLPRPRLLGGFARPRWTSTSSAPTPARYVELQGTAEGKPFDALGRRPLLDLADGGLERLFAVQAEAIASVKR